MKHKTIKEAVEPVRADAMKWAEKMAREQLTKIQAGLEASGWDIHKYAPYPKGSLGRNEYMTALRHYQIVSRLTAWRPGQNVGMHTPCFVDWDEKRAALHIKETREGAAAKYEAFVAKLEKKAGPHTGAELFGNHVWGYSYLLVQTKDGSQYWKTQQITNVSVNGLYFPQWPSRKVKAPGAVELAGLQ